MCAVLAKQPVFRLLAACLAFVPAMLFGVAAVNKYYGYYETWGAVVADFTSRGVQSIPQVPAAGAGSAQQFDQLLGNSINSQQAAQTGAEISVHMTGAASRLTRDVLIYLPPQYFQKQYASYRFPAIELIHGQPGQPEDWLAALDVQTTMQNLIAEHLADPAVLVMPDVNGGRKISLQCVNQVGGPRRRHLRGARRAQIRGGANPGAGSRRRHGASPVTPRVGTVPPISRFVTRSDMASRA